MPNTVTNNGNSGGGATQIQDNNPTNGTPQNPPAIRMEPIEPLSPQLVQPTASFAVDEQFNDTMYPLIPIGYIIHFRPKNDWKGQNFGFD